MAKKKMLTKKWYDDLLKELDDLKTNKLPAVLIQIREAKEAWDLSENAEYHSANEKQALLQVRASQLEEMLEWVEIIEESTTKDNIVRYWSKVLLKLNDDKEYEVYIVWWWEVKLWDETKISFNSPIWSVIEWKKEWMSFNLKLPWWRAWKVTILKVS